MWTDGSAFNYPNWNEGEHGMEMNYKGIIIQHILCSTCHMEDHYHLESFANVVDWTHFECISGQFLPIGPRLCLLSLTSGSEDWSEYCWFESQDCVMCTGQMTWMSACTHHATGCEYLENIKRVFKVPLDTWSALSHWVPTLSQPSSLVPWVLGLCAYSLICVHFWMYESSGFSCY